MSRRAALLLTVLGLLAAAVPAAVAGHEPLRLTEGEWSGTLTFMAGLSGEVGEEGRVSVDGYQIGDFHLEVIAEEVTGLYALSGSAGAELSGPGLAATGRGTFTGFGNVLGTAEVPVLHLTGGTVTVVVETGSTSVTQDVDVSGLVPPTELEIERLHCGVASGSWGGEVFISNVSAAGLTPRVRQGSFTAFEVDRVTQDQIDELQEALGDWFRDWGDTLFGPGTGATSDVGGLPAVNTEALMARMVSAVETLNKFQNLKECARELIGEDQIEEWESGIAGFIAMSIQAILSQSDASAYRVDVLTRVAAATGAIGEGSPFPETAVTTEEMLRLEAEEILQANAVTDGTDAAGNPCSEVAPCLTDDPDVTLMVTRGARMGWDYTLGGETRPATGWASA
ncbi:MAG: hypothetical protein WD184_05275 [Acidimicrobiia bacterium]